MLKENMKTTNISNSPKQMSLVRSRNTKNKKDGNNMPVIPANEICGNCTNWTQIFKLVTNHILEDISNVNVFVKNNTSSTTIQIQKDLLISTEEKWKNVKRALSDLLVSNTVSHTVIQYYRESERNKQEREQWKQEEPEIRARYTQDKSDALEKIGKCLKTCDEKWDNSVLFFLPRPSTSPCKWACVK
jgi:hypothetical protein